MLYRNWQTARLTIYYREKNVRTIHRMCSHARLVHDVLPFGVWILIGTPSLVAHLVRVSARRIHPEPRQNWVFLPNFLFLFAFNVLSWQTTRTFLCRLKSAKARVGVSLLVHKWRKQALGISMRAIESVRGAHGWIVAMCVLFEQTTHIILMHIFVFAMEIFTSVSFNGTHTHTHSASNMPKPNIAYAQRAKVFSIHLFAWHLTHRYFIDR